MGISTTTPGSSNVSNEFAEVGKGNELLDRTPSIGGTTLDGFAADGAGSSRPLTSADRLRMISDGAYHRAAARGFQAGYDLDDWLEAEREIDGQGIAWAPDISDS